MPVLEGAGTSDPRGTQTFQEQLGAFMQSIKDIESSGGNYMAKGPMTSIGQGLGAYQIMSSNWNAWASEAGIPGADWRDPAAQDKVARFKFSQYYEKFQSWDAVAVAWFAGPGRAADWIKDKSSVADMKDALGTDVASYAKRAVSGMRKHGANPDENAPPRTGGEFAQPPTQSAQFRGDTLESADEAIEGEGEGNIEITMQSPQSQLHPRDAANVVLASVADQLAGGDRLDARTLGKGGAMQDRGEDIEDPQALNPDTEVVT